MTLDFRLHASLGYFGRVLTGVREVVRVHVPSVRHGDRDVLQGRMPFLSKPPKAFFPARLQANKPDDNPFT
jgi:hypothetical protein